jgi:putative ABC transport system permease protein
MPHWFRWLVRGVPATDRAEIHEDLRELHAEQAMQRGNRRAAMWLFVHTIRIAFALRWSDVRLSGTWEDVRLASRTLRRAPGFSVAVITALALGIGTTTGIFSLVNGAFFAPIGIADPQRVVVIGEMLGTRVVSSSLPNALDIEARATAFSRVAAYQSDTATLRSGNTSTRVKTYRVTRSFFPLVHVTPLLGRALTVDDHQLASPPVVVLSHRGWTSAFASDPQAIGRSVAIDDMTYTVVGVMPADFEFYREADAWLPLEAFVPGSGLMQRDERAGIGVVARLKEGRTRNDAAAELRTLASHLAAEHTQANAGLAFTVDPMRSALVGPAGPRLWMLFVAVSALLAIGCLNATNLFAARLSSRREEFSTRLALGGSRFQLARQVWIESMVLSTAAGALGVIIAQALLAAASRTVAATMPGVQSASIDWRVLAFACGVSLAVGAVCGLVSAVASRLSARSTRTVAGSRERHRVRAALVIAQVALSLTLVTGGVFMTRTLAQLLSVDLGFDPAQVLTVDIQLNTPGDAEAGRRRTREFYGELVERLERLPGVTAGAVVNPLPIGGSTRQNRFWIEGRPHAGPDDLVRGLDLASVSGHYFDVMRIRLLRGQLFSGSERGPVSVAVVDELFAERFWPGEDPIGKHIAAGSPESGTPLVTIIGVVGSVRQISPDTPARPQVYVPFTQMPLGGTVLLRASSDPSALAPAVRRIVAELDAGAPVWATRPYQEVVQAAIASSALMTGLLTLFALLALALASLGIYGLMAFEVAQRQHEIGVRLALGGTAAHVRLEVARHGFILVAAGILVGFAGAIALARALAAVVAGITPADPSSYVVALCGVAAAGVLGTLWPTWRAVRVNPLDTLRRQ